jgi:hypothetical protein
MAYLGLIVCKYHVPYFFPCWNLQSMIMYVQYIFLFTDFMGMVIMKRKCKLRWRSGIGDFNQVWHYHDQLIRFFPDPKFYFIFNFDFKCTQWRLLQKHLYDVEFWWKENVNCDGQQFFRYQISEQSHQNSTSYKCFCNNLHWVHLKSKLKIK